MNALRQAELVCRNGQEPMLLGVRANGAIKGRLLAMSLEQRFRNAGDTPIEISYTFPLPFGAVLMGVDVLLNGQQLVGEVTAKREARARYEEALSEGNSGIMLERNGDHSYTLELGNLFAREECSVTVRYAQMLQLEQGQIRLMLPTTLAPRYGNPILQGGMQPHQVAVTDIAAEYPLDISVTLYGDLARSPVACLSHKTAYFPNGDELVVRLAQRGALDRDFILTLGELPNQSAALACVDVAVPGQTALMASFSPQLGDAPSRAVTAKILVDCSGSMAGDSIQAARNALHRIVAGLQPADRFSLSRFGSTVEHRSRGLWSGTVQAKASAKRWIDAVDADLGGTEMAEALVSTIAIAHQGSSDILLITDGAIEGIDEVIAVAIQSGHRIFVVAIGASPAEAHMRRLAAATAGACDFVAPGEDVEPAVLRMASRMRCSRAMQMRVEWPQSMGLRWVQALPAYAFSGDALNVAAFAETAGAQTAGVVRLWGCIDGAPGEQLLAQAELAVVESSANTLARVVACACHAQPLTQDSAKQDHALTALELALRYQLVTDETNFVLVHERTAAEKALEMPLLHKVPQMLAAGWGGSGSVVSEPHLVFSNRSTACAAPSYASMITPSVWRTNRASASVRVDPSGPMGMDDYDIPAFLRKQSADAPQYVYRSAPDDAGITPAELSNWLAAHAQADWPTSCAGLRHIGLGLALCEWLELELARDAREADVVMAFIAVVLGLGFTRQGVGLVMRALKGAIRPDKPLAADPQLCAAIRASLQGVQPASWPAALLNFPQLQPA